MNNWATSYELVVLFSQPNQISKEIKVLKERIPAWCNRSK
jgi:phage host-nuclease inhibitor protein Gam